MAIFESQMLKKRLAVNYVKYGNPYDIIYTVAIKKRKQSIVGHVQRNIILLAADFLPLCHGVTVECDVLHNQCQHSSDLLQESICRNFKTYVYRELVIQDPYIT